MNVLQMFAIYDAKVEQFMRPFAARTRGEAIRIFSDGVNGQDENLRRHAEDFTLFFIGEWSGETGMFTPSAPETLGNALQYREEEK